MAPYFILANFFYFPNFNKKTRNSGFLNNYKRHYIETAAAPEVAAVAFCAAVGALGVGVGVGVGVGSGVVPEVEDEPPPPPQAAKEKAVMTISMQ
jgi:hypothetical protein